MEKLVSIIVPIYNVERYLSKCIESIVKQTYTNLEIILIDDGSTDNCLTICDEYAIRDSRIRVIHKKNGGQSSARNIGLDNCAGEYISFVDSDDWISENMIEEMVRNIEKFEADISIIGYSMVWENGKIQKMSVENVELLFDHDEAMKAWLSQKYFKNFVWDKLFKQELFKDIRFPEGQNFMEDAAIGTLLFNRSSLIIYSGRIGYYYYQRKGSATNLEQFSKNDLVAIEDAKKMLVFSKENNGKYDEEVNARYMLALFLTIDKICKSRTRTYDHLLPQLVSEIKKNNDRNAILKYINRYNVLFIKALCIGFNPKLIMKSRNVLQKVKRKIK